MSDPVDVLQRAIDLFGNVRIYREVEAFTETAVQQEDGSVVIEQRDGPFVSYVIEDDEGELDFVVWDSPDLDQGASVRILLEELGKVLDG